MSATRYTTVAGPTDVECEIKRSVFLARLTRVADEDEARAFIAACRKDHHDARHHCSAFVLGPDQRTRRSSDDGEPAGTAGVPMLDALALAETAPGVRDLSDVCVVVTRWFGGIKLGAGGLVRAYSDSVSRAVAAATLVPRQRLAILALASQHADVGREESLLRHTGEKVLGTDYDGAGACVRIAVDDGPDAQAQAAVRLSGVLGRSVQLESLGAEWVDLV